MGAAIWVVSAVVLAVIEMFTMEFTCLSLALGCLAGGGAAALHLPLWVQICFAFAATAASLLVMAPMLRRRLTPRDTATATDLIVGSEALVVEAISPPGQGKVKLDGVVWQAIAQREIPLGAYVVVTELDGARLTVMARADLTPTRITSPLGQTEHAPQPQPQSQSDTV